MAGIRNTKTPGVGAPKGNTNAVKGLPAKDDRYLFKVTKANLNILKKIAKNQNTSMAQVIEKALLVAYLKEFDGRF